MKAKSEEIKEDFIREKEAEKFLRGSKK